MKRESDKGDGVGAGNDGDEQSHDQAADIGVVGFLIDGSGKDHSCRQPHQQGVDPDAQNHGACALAQQLCKQVAGAVKHAILDQPEQDRAQNHRDTLDQHIDPGLSIFYVVEGIDADTHDQVIHQEEGKILGYLYQLVRLEGPNGDHPNTAVGFKEPITDKDKQECAGDHGHAQHNGFPDGTCGNGNTPLYQTEAVFLALETVVKNQHHQ